ncbi:hypothetical protein H6P81_016022 [Aristolochia fimbriata]|uniref:Uncharacterized protein n=1 Tax=Aristolochia fimbriata TaxID=158543 RepID=A0AAV7E765_ARIFI|nr:hypothetical protein H6P81_016022 [Aristolochia fimbriata]
MLSRAIPGAGWDNTVANFKLLNMLYNHVAIYVDHQSFCCHSRQGDVDLGL